MGFEGDLQVGETPTLLGSLAGFAGLASGGLGGHDAALFLFDEHEFASFQFEVFRGEEEKRVPSEQ
jgi:hypothetical protein